jgi:phosphomannomutase
MNRSVVMRAAAGFAAYLRTSGASTVVVGFDARHKSDVFARDTNRVLAGAGLRALALPRPLPTPVAAFAIGHLGADGAVVVTASHNPPQDNGYKVYVGRSQIVPPTDTEISAQIDEVGPLDSIPTAESGWETLGEDVLDAYLDRAVSVLDPSSPRTLSIAYTPLHGVGGAVVDAAMSRAGFDPPSAVASQSAPDPDFPTVAFPNPEEPGAMDAAFEVASRVGADLAVANDPDADRCAVAIPVDGGWRMLRGDEVGALLAIHLINRHAEIGGTFATTIVSSSLLGKIATRHGLGYVETLTGFKWLTRVPGLRYAYEEALGYCVDPEAVLDKDGITALLLIAELAAGRKAAGSDLGALLDEIAVEYGLHATDQLAARLDDQTEIAAVMHRLREQPPESLGDRRVERVDDLADGSADLPPTEGLRFRLAGGARVVVRPSGTEPKIKCYLEVVVAVSGADVAAARVRATRELAVLRADVAAAAGLPG